MDPLPEYMSCEYPDCSTCLVCDGACKLHSLSVGCVSLHDRTVLMSSLIVSEALTSLGVTNSVVLGYVCYFQECMMPYVWVELEQTDNKRCPASNSILDVCKYYYPHYQYAKYSYIPRPELTHMTTTDRIYDGMLGVIDKAVVVRNGRLVVEDNKMLIRHILSITPEWSKVMEDVGVDLSV